MRDSLIIRDFADGDEAAFRALNEEWITRHFVLEAKDLEAFDDPRSTILAKGGRVFLAFASEWPVGCCALLAMGPGAFEIGKMAVTGSAQRTGVGRAVLVHAMEAARAMGATRLYLETNHALTPAIRLYESVGFRPVPPERMTPSPYARADVYMELLLPPFTV